MVGALGGRALGGLFWSWWGLNLKFAQIRILYLVSREDKSQVDEEIVNLLGEFREEAKNCLFLSMGFFHYDI